MESDLSRKIIEVAQSCVNLCACGPYRNTFRTVIGGGKDWDLSVPFQVINGKTVKGVSCCALFAWRTAQISWGDKCPWADLDFEMGQPIGRISELSKKVGAWVGATDKNAFLPPSGSIILNSHHVGIVESCDGEKLTTISGGQCCFEPKTNGGHEGRGLQAIKRKSEPLDKFVALGYVDPYCLL